MSNHKYGGSRVRDAAVGWERSSGITKAVSRRFPVTDVPTWMVLLLVVLAVPRTVLEDLGVVAPDSSLLYYLLALVPFVVWLVVAVARTSRRPFLEFLMIGVLYGLSLVLVHQVLWTVGPSLGHSPPASAVDFAAHFGPASRDLVLRVYTSGIAMMIGIGSGLLLGLIALGSNAWKARRRPRMR